jgi:hypothetical protein
MCQHHCKWFKLSNIRSSVAANCVGDPSPVEYMLAAKRCEVRIEDTVE